METNPEILIVGGGVIGLSIARELYRRGSRNILVVDSGPVGREASFAAAGMLAPNAENEVVDDFYHLCDESRQLFPELASELLAETGVDIELDTTGTIYASFSGEDSEHLAERYHRQTAAGIPVERLSAKETLAAEPCLSAGLSESLFFPNDWQVENRRLLAALKKWADAAGIIFLENSPVKSLVLENERITGAVTDSRTISAGTTVLATGAWTSLIKIANAAMPISVKPIKGQLISFVQEERKFRHVIYSPRGYLVPRADGRVLAGATVEDAGFDKTVTRQGVLRLQECAAEIAPFLKEADVIDSWAGLRPYADGGRPVIGPIPGLDGLFIATAHYRNGILLAPLTARIIAEKIADGVESLYFARFGPTEPAAKGENAGAR